MMQSKAVLFDLDETLFDRTRSLMSFIADQIERCPELQFDTPERVIQKFLNLDQRGRVPKTDVYAALVADHSESLRQTVADLVAEYETGFSRFARPFPGLQHTLSSLRKMGARTGIITNGQTDLQTRTIRALKLENQIDTCLISEAEGLRKPDPRIFHLAAQRLGVQPSECLFVGDTPITDVCGAKRAGLKGVWFPNGTHWPDDVFERPDATISALEEVLYLFRAWR